MLVKWARPGPLSEEASPSTAPFSLALLLLCRRVRRRLALSPPPRPPGLPPRRLRRRPCPPPLSDKGKSSIPSALKVWVPSVFRALGIAAVANRLVSIRLEIQRCVLFVFLCYSGVSIRFFFLRFSGSVEVICRNSCDIDSTSLLRRLLSHTCTRMKKNLFEKKSFSFNVS